LDRRGRRGAEDAEDHTLNKLNTISGQVVDAAMRVHSALGPGLLESAYAACLEHELRKRGLKVETQVTLPLVYDGMTIAPGHRIDMLVESTVVVELKTVNTVRPIHEAQLLSY
jgi:GxxExxY protein